MSSKDGMAITRNAPRLFGRTTRHGLPIFAVCFCSAFSFLAFMSVKSGSSKVFQWFVNLVSLFFALFNMMPIFLKSSIAGLMTWFGIGITYIRFYAGLKAQGYDRKKLPYAHWMQPFAGYYVIFMTFIICLVISCACSFRLH